MRYITPANYHEQKRTDVHVSQRQHHVEPVSSPLYVITVITNPWRYYTRYKLYQRFEKMCEDAGAILYTIELALRDRHFEITDHNNPRHIQLRSPAELWFKENLINIAVSRLPEDWRYVAWVDADIQFTRPDWAVETVHMLQHYKIIQMFSHAIDLGPNFQPLMDSQVTSFLKSFIDGKPLPYKKDRQLVGCSGGGAGDWRNWHSGYCWAARRSALSDLGGLGDIAILGSSDHHMASALIGIVDRTIHGNMTNSFKQYWNIWQERALKYIDRNIGYMEGLIYHYWHGSKQLRRYKDRWAILTENKFDHELDIKRDVQGLWQFTDRNWRLRNDIQKYFRERDEDSTHLF